MRIITLFNIVLIYKVLSLPAGSIFPVSFLWSIDFSCHSFIRNSIHQEIKLNSVEGKTWKCKHKRRIEYILFSCTYISILCKGEIRRFFSIYCKLYIKGNPIWFYFQRTSLLWLTKNKPAHHFLITRLCSQWVQLFTYKPAVASLVNDNIRGGCK